MDLGQPISSVIPGAYGDVIAVLARTDVWLSGRKVAALTRGQTSRRRVDAVLAELAKAGIADMQEVPPGQVVSTEPSPCRRGGYRGTCVDAYLLAHPTARRTRTVEDNLWSGQIDALRERVREWSGNDLEVLVLSADELRHLRDAGERLIDELRADAVVLVGSAVRDILESRVATR